MTLEPRLAAHVQVSTFVRRAQQQGDFATILHKGDETSGSILLVGLIRGNKPLVYERFPSLEGDDKWSPSLREESPSQADIDQYVQKRISRDPDIWVIELDTADDERLARLIG